MTKLDMASANEDNHKPAAAMSSRMLSGNVIIGISAFCLAFIACSGVAYLYLRPIYTMKKVERNGSDKNRYQYHKKFTVYTIKLLVRIG